jgi:hypothetical protein
MNLHFRIISVATLLLTFSWINPAISSVTGIAVGDVNSMGQVGIQDPLTGIVEYFIPLSESDSGVYGVDDSPTCGVDGVGTCSDSGSGFGYDDESKFALKMNIYFDLSNLANKDNSVLDIWFDDLDLVGINDPGWFYESVSVAGKKAGDVSLTNIASTKTLASEITTATQDPFTWSLSLSSLDLDNTDNDVWIQLEFDSKMTITGPASNTPEYLKATISTVPVPAAVWLFGTALIGFVGMSRRTAVT